MDVEEDEEEDEKNLIESFTELTLDQSKEGLRRTLDDRVRLRRLVRHTNEEVLVQMADAGLGDFWFIALKRHYPRELFRLYELNRFTKHRHHFVVSDPSVGNDDGGGSLGILLNRIYHEILMPLDETLFYPDTFLDQSVGEDVNVVKYFSRFVLGVGYENLYRGIMDPTKDSDRVLFDKMRRTSLFGRYVTSKGSYRRFIQYGENINYTVRDVVDREVLFYIVVGLYSAIRLRSKEMAMIMSDADGDRMLNEVRGQFDAIAQLYANRSYDVRIDLKSAMEIVLPIYRADVQSFVLFNTASHEESAHYSVLFRDEYRDDDIRLDRHQFNWLLPFDVGGYSDRRRIDGGANDETIRAEIKTILLQESYLWVNMLIYEMYIASLMGEKGDKKRTSDDDGDVTNKKLKIGRIVITAHTEKTDLLSLLHGSGSLSLFFNQGKTERYRIAAGDNIQIPRNMINYHMKYDEDDEEEEEEETSSSFQ